MNNLLRIVHCRYSCLAAATFAAAAFSGGCGPNYRELRWQGQQAMLDGSYGAACHFFERAEERAPRRVENLHDLGACRLLLARQRFEGMNHAAAMRELDEAVARYSQALEVQPSHQASIVGKNVALKLKGQFDEALAHAEWAARFIGPSASQYIFLAGELEERGDVDGALLRYRQAVAVDPDDPGAHIAFARFLLKHDNAPAAVHHLQAAYRLDPRDTWVVDQLTARSAVPPLVPEGAGKP